MINKPYIEYTHVDTEVSTVSQFLDPSSDSIGNQISISDFCKYKGDTNKRNVDRIWESYTIDEQSENQGSYESGELLIDPWGDLLFKKNTTVLLPKERLNREILGTIGKNQEIPDTEFITFLGRKLSELVKDSGYKPVVKTKHLGVQFPDVSVWLWSRALSDNEEGELQGTLIDITPFVTDITTGVGPTGGDFTISLTPSQVKDFGDLSPVQVFFINTIKNGKLKRNISEVYRVINTNDVVFIKFETLELEKKDRAKKKTLLKSDLSNQIYDMIGLVDFNTISTSPAQTDISISIVGRDIMKLLIEDGSYFYVFQFAANLYTNVSELDKVYKRNIVSGDYSNLLIAKRYQSISFIIRFIINHLSNMGVVPDSLFSEYKDKEGKDKRSYVYRLDEQSQTYQNQLSSDSEVGVKQVWAGDMVPLASTSDPQFENQENFPYTEKLANGLWQIVKLAFDKSVSYRRIKDSSISQPDGSIMNQFMKICQDPFVEFFGDTYGDLFYLIVRQPPFTQQAINSFLSMKKTDSSERVMIEIDDEDIISDNLTFDEDGVFSWFEIHPQGVFIGQSAEVALSYIPAVFFPKYADIWGNRRLQITTNYIPYNGIVGSGGAADRQALVEFIANDLKYIIDIHAYLPFVRKGSLTINGDRRIKRGTYIKLTSTNEIFYVDSVRNNYSTGGNVDRTTSLNISRGMVEKYINDPEYNYFKIVDTEYIKKFIISRLSEDVGSTLEIRKDYGVNEKVFNFFFKRSQFK